MNRNLHASHNPFFPLLLVIALALTASTVSYDFNLSYIYPKYLVIGGFLLLLAFGTVPLKIQFYLIKDKAFSLLLGGIFLSLSVASLSFPYGAKISGLNNLALWIILVFYLAAYIARQGLESFLRLYFRYQFFFIAMFFAIIFHNELFIKSTVRPFFGNPNITANFVALSTLTLVFGSVVESERWLRVGAWILSACGYLLLSMLIARGALLGLTAGAFVFFGVWLSPRKSDFDAKWPRFFSPRRILLLMLFLCVILLGRITLQKWSYTFSRLPHWINTLCLIRDYPLGIGPGAYELVFEKYNGKCVASSEPNGQFRISHPHNMYLEFIAEAGIAGGLLVLLVLGLSLWAISKMSSQNRFPVAWLLGNVFTLLVIGLFEFPQDTPYTFFILALLAAMGLLLLGSPLQKGTKISYVGLFVASLIVLQLGRQSYSDYLLRRREVDRVMSLKLAYSLDPENFEAGFNLVERYTRQNKIDESEKLLSQLELKLHGARILERLRRDLIRAKTKLAQK